jgi:hypothetical protein
MHIYGCRNEDPDFRRSLSPQVSDIPHPLSLNFLSFCAPFPLRGSTFRAPFPLRFSTFCDALFRAPHRGPRPSTLYIPQDFLHF